MKCLAIAFSLVASLIVMLDWRIMPDFLTSLVWPMVLGVTLISPWLSRIRYLGLAWLLALSCWICPYDVSTTNVPGPPRFIPFVSTKFTPRLNERMERGELFVGGHLRSSIGAEPKWVLVW